MEFCKSNILATHCLDGALQGNMTFKKNGYELLEGWKTIKDYSEKFFKCGWYNDRLQFCFEVTEEDLADMNDVLIF